jgi:alpha-galactosidase
VPWLSLGNHTQGVEYLAELAWSGNWRMEIERQPGTGAAPLGDQPVRIELGMHNDFGGPLTLLPGDTITLPRALFTATSGDLDDAANQMHRYQRRYLVPRVKTNQFAPEICNHWMVGDAASSYGCRRSGVR